MVSIFSVFVQDHNNNKNDEIRLIVLILRTVSFLFSF